jgi:hypothetical protein
LCPEHTKAETYADLAYNDNKIWQGYTFITDEIRLFKDNETYTMGNQQKEPKSMEVLKQREVSF